MARCSRLIAPALAMVLCAACSLAIGGGGRRSPSDQRPRPVVLILDGSAFERARAREAVVAAVRRVTRRQVVVAAAPSSARDGQVQRLAARFARENPRIATYDWREPQCAAESLVLTALAYDVGAVYRVSLTRAERWRPASEVELRAGALHHAASRVLAALHLARSGVVLEESVSGTIVMSSFTASGAGRRVGMARRATLVEPSPLTPRLGVGSLVREAMGALPPPRDPQWEAAAHRLLSSGCPFLALAVSDLRPGLAGGQPGIRTAALGAIRQELGRREALQLASETAHEFEAALREERLDTAASILARYAAHPASRSETVTELAHQLDAARHRATPRAHDDGPYSCSALCAMHMVDICNRDRALWESNRTPWEQTACGIRRAEAFLKECYQQQWLTGAFHEGCIVPCERSAEGRERLIAILRGAGCHIRLS